MRNRKRVGIWSRFGGINGAGGVAYRQREGFARVIIISLSQKPCVGFLWVESKEMIVKVRNE